MSIAYAVEPQLSAAEFIDVLERSTLAERRPVGDVARIEKMLANADLMLTARDAEGDLVGVARAVTDFSYCCYLSDLAVDRASQGRGIGTELMKRTRAAAGDETNFILVSAPAAVSFYPQAGLQKFDTCFGVRGPWPEETAS